MNKAVRIIEMAPYDVIFIKILISRFRHTHVIKKYIIKLTYVCEKTLKVIASIATGKLSLNTHVKIAKIIG